MLKYFFRHVQILVFAMSSSSGPIDRVSSAVVWSGRPWILPSALVYTILLIVLGAAVIWFESLVGVVYDPFMGLQIWLWTGLGLFVLWLILIFRLLLIRASHSYLLRKDSLEVRSGIVSTKTYVVVASGFSDLQVNQSAIGRLVNSGDILVNAQSDREVCMKMVRRPQSVGASIREILGKPIVRIEEHERV